MRRMLVVLAVMFSTVTVGVANTRDVARTGRGLARKAVSENSSESVAAIAALRTRGQSGSGRLPGCVFGRAQESRAWISSPQHRDRPTLNGSGSATRSIRFVSSEIATLRVCFGTRISTKLKPRQSPSGKPILSLRLLGRLDEELSCANSRFFRLILYSNTEVSALLREHFILHWQSVRPVPKVTIDFGDGRKLERTLTGNSIHYILDSDGRPMDALPGLYGPQAFIRELTRAERVAAVCRAARRRRGARQRYCGNITTRALMSWRRPGLPMLPESTSRPLHRENL